MQSNQTKHQTTYIFNAVNVVGPLIVSSTMRKEMMQIENRRTPPVAVLTNK